MPIVTIDSDLGSRGAEVAQQAAAGLDYRLVRSAEVFTEAARRYGLPQEQLRRAFAPPPLLNLSRTRRAHARACYGAVLLESLLEDGVVYHGFDAHRWVVGVSHALRVRVTGELALRAAAHSETTGLRLPVALKAVKVSDAHRGSDDSPYDEGAAEPDLILDCGVLGVPVAAARIVAAARERCYSPMSYSQKQMRKIVLESRVRAELLTIDPHARVALNGMTATVKLIVERRPSEIHVERLRRCALAIDEVEDVDVQVVVDKLGGFIDANR